MDNRELIQWVEQESSPDAPIDFPPELLAQISAAQAEILAKEFGAATLMKLPAAEIEFFEWLKVNDPDVWNDLWNSEEEGAEPYVVGLALLGEVLREDRGFPICDLVTVPNFHFTNKHILHEEAKPYVDAVLQKVEDKVMLSPAEVFILEIRRAPLDIWRFAYRYGLTIGQAKAVIHELVHGGILHYTPTKEELSEFLEF